jgi:hypothetical protein
MNFAQMREYVKSGLTWASALFAIAAAVLWFMSARVTTPDSFSIHVVRSNSPFGQPLGQPLGATFVGTAHSADLVELANALRRQSKLSAYAAVCAAASAVAQAIALAL